MTTNSHACPHCRLPTGLPGRYVCGFDEAGQHFVYAICYGCSLRLNRLPLLVQKRHHDAAIHRLAEHPERYPYRMTASAPEARMLTVLLAEMSDQAEALRLLLESQPATR